MSPLTIQLTVLDYQGLLRFNDHWDLFVQDISEPYQIQDENGEMSWASNTQNEEIATLLEKVGLVAIHSIGSSINLTEVSSEWNSDQKHEFLQAKIACNFLRRLVTDDLAEQVSRRLMRNYGRCSPQFYGWDSNINHRRYTGTVTQDQ